MEDDMSSLRTSCQAVWADVGNIFLVPAFVEEAADLMHPSIALVAGNPGFLLLLVILPLDDVILLYSHPVQLQIVLPLLREAGMAPVALHLGQA